MQEWTGGRRLEARVTVKCEPCAKAINLFLDNRAEVIMNELSEEKKKSTWKQNQEFVATKKIDFSILIWNVVALLRDRLIPN